MFKQLKLIWQVILTFFDVRKSLSHIASNAIESKQRLLDIETLAKEISELSEFPVEFEKGNRKIIEITDGVIELFGLYKNDKCAITLVKVKAGASMKEHYHNEVEIFGMIDGTMVVHKMNEVIEVTKGSIAIIEPKVKTTIILNTGEAVIIKKEIPHYVEYVTDCFQWAITMPASDVFPEGIKLNGWEDFGNA